MFPRAYKDYLIHFHGSRDYFECHEVLEEYWKEQEGKDRFSIWVGLIQIAVALYHQRIGNFKGAYRTLKKALNILDKRKEEAASLGLDYDQLTALLQQRLLEINDGKGYYSINLPIADKQLLTACINECNKLGLVWNEQSDLSNKALIYKHSLRDRSVVRNERELQLQLRKNNRPGS